jgi:hypothetical protein
MSWFEHMCGHTDQPEHRGDVPDSARQEWIDTTDDYDREPEQDDQPSMDDYLENPEEADPSQFVNPDRVNGACEHCGQTFGQWGVRASKMCRRHEEICPEADQ